MSYWPLACLSGHIINAKSKVKVTTKLTFKLKWYHAKNKLIFENKKEHVSYLMLYMLLSFPYYKLCSQSQWTKVSKYTKIVKKFKKKLWHAPSCVKLAKLSKVWLELIHTFYVLFCVCFFFLVKLKAVNQRVRQSVVNQNIFRSVWCNTRHNRTHQWMVQNSFFNFKVQSLSFNVNLELMRAVTYIFNMIL